MDSPAAGGESGCQRGCVEKGDAVDAVGEGAATLTHSDIAWAVVQQ